MRFHATVMLILAALVAGCGPNMSPFEDRSHKVDIEHRVPSK